MLQLVSAAENNQCHLVTEPQELYCKSILKLVGINLHCSKPVEWVWTLLITLQFASTCELCVLCRDLVMCQRLVCLKNYCSLLYIPFPAIIVLLWDYFMFLHDLLIRHFGLSTLSGIWLYCLGGLMGLGFISFPFFGLLADVWIGRYKAILTGIVLCFLSWLIVGIGYILYYYSVSVKLMWSFYCISVIFGAIGYGCFKANIIQFNIDQIVGASSKELNTIIYWHTVSLPVVSIVSNFLHCFITQGQRYFLLSTFIMSGVSVSLVLVSHSLFKDKLENISLIKNPIKLIVRVLCYARKHKYPENRSALTYWEEEAPSQIDLGKEKYGGPFTDEEVEDVKTIFRMLPLFIGITCYAFSVHQSLQLPGKNSFIPCLIDCSFWRNVSALILLLAYLLVMRMWLYKCIPSMLSRINIGLFIGSVAALLKLVVVKFLFSTKPSLDNNMSIIIFQVLEGVMFFFIVPATLEFTIAQSPIHSRGVMIGIWNASWGIGLINNMVISSVLGCQFEYACSNLYHYLVKFVVILLTLIIFLILAKHYKYRVRGNEVNIVQIVDDHYQRYMEQEAEYMKHNIVDDSYD